MKIRSLTVLAGCSFALLLTAPLQAARANAATPAKKSMPPTSQQQTAAWHKLVDEYFDQVYLRYNPTAGTSAGLHQYDSKLENYSRACLNQQAGELHSYEAKVSAFPTDGLSEWDAGDRAFLLGNIRSQILTLEKIRSWGKNPTGIPAVSPTARSPLSSATMRLQDVRLKALIAREQQMPAALPAARTNLVNPPKIYTQIALEQLPGIIGFFQKDIPAAFSGVKDRKLLAQFHASNEAVIQALTSYQQWVKTDLLPRSNGDFRISAACAACSMW